MEIYTKRKNGIIILIISGDLDINSSELIEVIGWHVRNGRIDLILDFENVNLIDYAGISALTIAFKNVVNFKGRLKICNMPVHIRNLLNSVLLDTVFEIYETLDDAVASFKEDKAITDIKKMPLRRRFDRLSMDIPVEYRPKTSRDEDFFDGKAFNLSGVGAFVFAQKIFPIGETLMIRIKLAPKPGTVEIEGRVLWLADKKTQPQLYPGMGIEFVNMQSQQQKKILQFIERNAASSKST